ncbi:MAG: LysR family transcriptional regulator [Porticoccaceae bacterium]|nr:LysR family transcriptional regulator [Porticoccaceae bacterium]
MDTQLLEAFIAVVESGSFSHAAERVHLTQPAVSKRIAQLEQQLDCRLFDRIARNVSLTEAGTALLPRARNILLSVEETRQSIRDLSGTVAGNLRLAISHHIGLHRLPPVLKDFTTRHPKVRVDIDFMESETAYEAVRQGRFEIAVITLAPEQHPSLQAFPLWRDHLQLVVAPDHPLTQVAGLDVARLSNYPAILPDLSTYTGRKIKQFFDQGEHQLSTSIATNYLETIKMMVSVGLGWSMLPAIMIDDSLRQLRCQGLALERTLGYIHHQNRSLSNAAEAFIQLLRNNSSGSQ